MKSSTFEPGLRPSRSCANEEKQNFRKLGKRKGVNVLVIEYYTRSAVCSVRYAVCVIKNLLQLTTSGSTVF